MLIEAKQFLAYAAGETISLYKTSCPTETRASLAGHNGIEPGSCPLPALIYPWGLTDSRSLHCCSIPSSRALLSGLEPGAGAWWSPARAWDTPCTVGRDGAWLVPLPFVFQLNEISLAWGWLRSADGKYSVNPSPS